MVGDGFGGRLWYKPTNYTVGSYSAFSICYSGLCGTGTNQLYGWGRNLEAVLGYDPLIVPSSNVPIPIPNMTNLKYYSTGYNMGAIKNDGTGWVWGYNLFNTPTQVISNVKFVDGSAGYATFVKNDGTVWSIGANFHGQFGDGTINSNFISPVQMAGINNAVRVACGMNVTYILLTNGNVKVVGHNSMVGFLGINDSISSEIHSPVDIIPLSNIVDVKACTNAAAALTSTGDVYCWGKVGYTGTGSILQKYAPVKVVGLSNVVAISACCDGNHFLALDANKNCYGWGGSIGQFGTPNAAPIPIKVADKVVDIMAGETFSYIVKEDGTLWGSGSSNAPGSIWLNISNSSRSTFTLINPDVVPGACSVRGLCALGLDTLCSGNGEISIYNFGGASPYQYNIGNGNQNSNVFYDLYVGSYVVTVTDANGCVDTVTCIVKESGNITIAAYSPSIPDSIAIGTILELTNNSTNANSIEWIDCAGQSSSQNILKIETKNLEECCIKLVAKNGVCSDTIKKCVKFYDKEKVSLPFIFIPNIFTPNGDVVNEVFCISNKGIAELSCIIYNRWGGKIFEWNDLNGYWDGKNAPDGTYYYIVHYTEEQSKEQKIQKGFVTLVR